MKKTKKNPLKDTANKLENKSDILDGQHTACSLMLELYPDDSNYCCNDIIHHLVNYCESHNCMYAYILHDKDIFSNTEYNNDYSLRGRKGDLKKPHYHFIMATCTSSPLVISDVFLGVSFPSRFIKIIKPKDINNVVLYLSHIKYPNKYFYDWKSILTNKRDFIDTLHEEYTPSSSINFICLYLKNNPNKIVSTAFMWDLCLNQNNIPYKDFKDNYSIIKDILKEHNLNAREENIKMKLYDDVRTSAILDSKQATEKMYNLAIQFGATGIDIDGKKFTLVYNGEKKEV